MTFPYWSTAARYHTDVAGGSGLVPAPTAADGATGRSQDPQHRTNDQDDDPDRPENGDVGEETDDEQDETEDDHCESFRCVRRATADPDR